MGGVGGAWVALEGHHLTEATQHSSPSNEHVLQSLSRGPGCPSSTPPSPHLAISTHTSTHTSTSTFSSSFNLAHLYPGPTFPCPHYNPPWPWVGLLVCVLHESMAACGAAAARGCPAYEISDEGCLRVERESNGNQQVRGGASSVTTLASREDFIDTYPSSFLVKSLSLLSPGGIREPQLQKCLAELRGCCGGYEIQEWTFLVFTPDCRNKQSAALSGRRAS